VYAVNTLGAIAGVVRAVHPLLGALGLRHADRRRGDRRIARRRAPGVAALPAGIASFAPAVAGSALALVATGSTSTALGSGVFRTIASLKTNVILTARQDRDGDVVDEEGFRLIRTNGKSDASITMKGRGSSRDEYTMVLGALPLGHKPDAKSAALMASAPAFRPPVVLSSPTIERVDTVEIEPAWWRARSSSGRSSTLRSTIPAAISSSTTRSPTSRVGATSTTSSSRNRPTPG
jgi:hypothetical protein